MSYVTDKKYFMSMFLLTSDKFFSLLVLQIQDKSSLEILSIVTLNSVLIRMTDGAYITEDTFPVEAHTFVPFMVPILSATFICLS